ncbi:hypothetical protein MVEN_02151800 [Mycena venus]|uniref:Protein kinase domain-containing protein n=1 Tax=Mycena venus TaxID=2733690 RepID=A0A8H7CIZ2_9AGAR|nr:hypothetical protein MVEN_02151800 [Mycena venus]
MDAETHMEPEESTTQSDLDILRRTCNAAFINHSARDINFKDCVTNVTFTAAPTAPSGFRRIPLGDINLLHEICVDYDTGVVDRHERMQVRRRVYSAQVQGQSVTAVFYQGDGAEEEWRRDLEKHRSLWHPNIIQIYGTASSHGINATLYHDDLIPFQHFLDLYRHSPMMAVYIHACSIADFNAAHNYIYSTFKEFVPSYECTLWIHRSTGQLCAELTIPVDWIDLKEEVDEIPGLRGVHSLRTSNTEAMIIDMLTLKGYHDVCFWVLLHEHNHNTNVSLSMIVNVGAVILWPRDDVLEHRVEIASLTDAEIDVGSWFNSGKGYGEKLENGWTRSEDVIGRNIYLWIKLRGADFEFWLSQANHIFSCLEITSDLGDYGLVIQAGFILTILTSKVDCPSGFLFLCPENHLRIGPSSFAWPYSPAYWSLDSLGVNRLSTEEATQLGFPTIQRNTEIDGEYWDDSVYAGLRQFHQAKGFDPDSQDVARHLRLPLYQLSNEIEVPFAHVTEEDPDEEEDWDEDVNTTDESKDRQSAAIKENGMLLEESVLHSYSEGHVPFVWHKFRTQNEAFFSDTLTAGFSTPGQQVTHYGVSNTGPDATIDGSWNTDVYGGVGQFYPSNVFNIGPHLGQPLDKLSHDANVTFAHVEVVAAGEVQGLSNTERQFDDLWPSASADHVLDIDRETIPAKRSFEKTAVVLHENISEQGLEGSIQDNLALRRLMLEEKAQLIEMQRLGMFTKEEFISRLAQIDAHYEEPVARLTPARRPRLSY